MASGDKISSVDVVWRFLGGAKIGVGAGTEPGARVAGWGDEGALEVRVGDRAGYTVRGQREFRGG